MATIGCVVDITAAFSVMDEWCAEAVAQVGYQAGEGGTRKAVISDEHCTGEYSTPSIQQTVQAVNFIKFAQVFQAACFLSFNSLRRLFLFCDEVCCIRRILANLGVGTAVLMSTVVKNERVALEPNHLYLLINGSFPSRGIPPLPQPLSRKREGGEVTFYSGPSFPA